MEATSASASGSSCPLRDFLNEKKQEVRTAQASSGMLKADLVQSITNSLKTKYATVCKREHILDVILDIPDTDEKQEYSEPEPVKISTSVPENQMHSLKTKTSYTMPPLSLGYSIYRVPERLRRVKEEAYTPRRVSIGPFHHGNKSLEGMEYDKLRYLNVLLHRPSARPLKEYVEMLLKLERRARNCYAETFSYSKKEFVEMMLLDGCFIVELFRQYHILELRNESDQIFNNVWIFNAIHRDLLLLENQLPFFVLKALFTLITTNESPSFIELTNSFLDHYNPIRQNNTSPSDDSVIEHLVHLVLEDFTSQLVQHGPRNKSDDKDLVFIPSATQLQQVGIKFKGSNFEKTSLLEVEFKDGLLSIPTLLVDHRTESLFRNLIAFEQSHSRSTVIGPGRHNQGVSTTLMSDYVTVMDCLINTTDDVAFLRDQGIIHNHLGDNKEVAELFNKLRNGTVTCSSSTGFHYCDIFKAVNTYYKVEWHGMKATLKREYFNTPWAKISFGAASFLLIFSALQTIYAIKFHN